MKAKVKPLLISEAEEAEIRDYARVTGEQEAVVLGRAAMRGLREERLEWGFRALRNGASSSEAAAIAGIDRHTFLSEAVERDVPLLDDGPAEMLHDLAQFAAHTGDERLAKAVEAVSQKLCSNKT